MIEQPLEFTAITTPNTENLPIEDGIPLETPWHRAEINLLLEVVDFLWQGRTDYYAGGNMFIYFSSRQIRHQEYRGPDFFVVKDVDGLPDRKAWIVWEEDGRYPDLIIELLSPSTAESDKTTKKHLYERIFRTSEYFCYDPATQELLGWHLQNSQYEELEPDENGRLWSSVLQVWLGNWQGKFIGRSGTWLRFFDEEGFIIPISAEAEAAARQAAEAELSRLQQELAQLKKQAK